MTTALHAIATKARTHPRHRFQNLFLGFEFYWSRDVNGRPRLRRRTAAERQKAVMTSAYR